MGKYRSWSAEEYKDWASKMKIAPSPSFTPKVILLPPEQAAAWLDAVGRQTAARLVREGMATGLRGPVRITKNAISFDDERTGTDKE